MVVSDVCQCVSHPNHHQTLRCAFGPPSTLHLVNHQKHHAFLHATHRSITPLSQLSFLLYNDVFFIVTLLVTIERVCGCDGMHHSFALIIKHVVCVTLLPSSVVITLLWCFCCGAYCSPDNCASHTCTPHLDSVFEWQPRGFTQSTCHPLHQQLHLVVATKVHANDGFHFKVVWQVTITDTGPIHQSPSSECLPTPHITPHGSMSEQC